MVNETPFADVQVLEDGFSIPDLKWRELIFTGAMRAVGDAWVRDPSRDMTPFAQPDLLPEGVRFHIVRANGRVHVRRAQPGAPENS
jgi:hypothetical protein